MRSCSTSVRHSEPGSGRSNHRRCTSTQTRTVVVSFYGVLRSSKSQRRRTHAAVCGIEMLDDDDGCCRAASVCWCAGGISSGSAAIAVGVGVGIASRLVARIRVTAQARLDAILARKVGRVRIVCVPLQSGLGSSARGERLPVSMNQLREPAKSRSTRIRLNKVRRAIP